MRKHSARKWLHFFLDLLPIILIPVFMIYSHRHTLTESVDLDITYKYQTNEVNTINDLVEGNIYHFEEFEFYDYSYTYEMYFLQYENFEIEYDSFIPDELINETYNANNGNYVYFWHNYNETSSFIQYTNETAHINVEFNNLHFIVYEVDFIISGSIASFKSFCNNEGIIPTKSDFNVIESVEIQDTNSDIMSVFMNDFNNVVNNYFNMQQVFNFSDIYNWLNVNMFGGTAPAVILSVYNIIVYEFLMDLIFLMYSIFMFIIDFSQELLSRCFSFSRHGGSR